MIKYYPERYSAIGKVRYALELGKIKKPSRCLFCDMEKPLEGHHFDYKKPLDVVWLCSSCHKKLHYFLRKIVSSTN